MTRQNCLLLSALVFLTTISCGKFSITGLISQPTVTTPPPLPGLIQTFDYVPARDGLAILSGGPTNAGYIAAHAANNKLVWQPRFQSNGTTIPQGNEGYYHYNIDPGYAWSNSFNPFSIDTDGNLLLRAQSTANVTPAFNTGEIPTDPATGSSYDWLSGILTTEASFKQIGGYFEMEAKLPNGYANWPAFWLFADGATPEIDVIEIFGGSPGYTAQQYSTNVISLGYVQHSTTPSFPIDLSQDFHTYGVYFDDATITFYFDRVAFRTSSIAEFPEFATPMFMLISNQVGSRISGFVPVPDSSTSNPSDMQVRAVRAWQRPGVVGLDLSALSYLDSTAVGGTVATLNATTFGGNNSIQYSVVDDPDNMFTTSGNLLQLRQVVLATTSDSHAVTLKATDSAGRSFTRKFTIGVVTDVPTQTNLIASQNLQSGWGTNYETITASDTIAETIDDGLHQLYVSAPISKSSSTVQTFTVFTDIDASVGRPYVQLFVFNGSYSEYARGTFNLDTKKVGYISATTNFTISKAFIISQSNGKTRIGFTFQSDATAQLRPLFSFGTDLSTFEYPGSTSAVTKISNIWLYQRP